MIGGLVIAVLFLVLVACAEWIHHRFDCPVEWTRKLVHLGGGVVCLAMPFWIQSHWIVLALALSMVVLFVGSRQLGLLNSVHGVQRKSRGSEYYPVVIYLLFLLASQTPWKFVICVLVLAVADSVAAIIGKKFGRWEYRVEDEFKTIEGSLAFFAATLVSVLIPLMIFRPQFESLAMPDWHYVLAAMLIGLLVTCFEAVSRHGRDNLFIPLGTWLVLTKTFQTDVQDLVIQNLSFIMILLVVVGLARRSRSFQTGGSIVLTLATYGCWSLGSFDWALPVLTGFGLYVVCASVAELPWKLSIRPVLSNVLIPFLILVIGNIALNQGYAEWTRFCFGPFLAACCVALSQAVMNAINWKQRRKLVRRLSNGALAALVCYLLLVLPLVYRMSVSDTVTLAVFAVVTMLGTVISAVLLPPLPPAKSPRIWLSIRMAITASAAVVIALLQHFSICQVW